MKKILIILTTLCFMISMFLGMTVSAADDTADAYLGCDKVGIEQWSVLLDYIWAPFTPDKGLVSSVDAFVNIRAGAGTFTIGVYTDYYGKGQLLGETTMDCNFDTNQEGWQTLIFDTPVAVNPGETYYLRFSSEDVKVTLWGLDSPTPNDPYHEWVDAGRAGNGWTNNRLANFVVHTSEAEGDDPATPDDPVTVYGDVNGDGKVNNRDLGALQQYLNDWDVTINLAAADVTGDDEVNVRDYGLLQQYLNDWDVVLK
jgi:hypothetical protein